MENVSQEEVSSAPSQCTLCHQPLLPIYYFCPNCGTQVKLPPLSTTFRAQLWMYILSIILPALCYIIIGKWKGLQYLKSQEPKARMIGIIACILLLVSTVLTFWFANSYTQKIVQQALGGASVDIESGY